MALPDIMEFDYALAVEWEERLRSLASELEEQGMENSAMMLYAAAALMNDKVRQLGPDTKKVYN